jgi:DNA-binding NtrC family response regulator
MQIVLVIDSDAQQRNLVLDMLQEEGFAVRSAAGAEEGFAMLQEGGIDAVVLPTGNDSANVDLLVRIRTTFPNVAVVAIAKAGWREGARGSNSISSIGVVPTPFNRAQIASVLNRVQLAAKSLRERLLMRCLY